MRSGGAYTPSVGLPILFWGFMILSVSRRAVRSNGLVGGEWWPDTVCLLLSLVYSSMDNPPMLISEGLFTLQIECPTSHA